ncbi:adenine glycosylase [Leadbettera azotonutricia]|uniref:A/G-specific adenine glycosylase n=1 Tax=Leadbettera azotonutricia (strain ATCC BAA-888 / DSM 13862 / ZAS-9) TaxID=545695 RepID=F5YAT4_LEAAZ|nr:adenine glycosylase [Leadbettera azotonutricia]AEF83227.1 A/G-specific adenine glycosylase [Leadbettera azotonutricia ZAS-9]
MERKKFRSVIYSYYDEQGRSFPWRRNLAPWGILVSEFMLQQTQTERAVSYWERWMEKWPTAACLDKAPLEEVLKEWSGLGYNRRAMYIKECANIITTEHKGIVPQTPESLLELPGIGPYCSGAISCFAYNYPSVFIETNIRAVMLHFFFKDQEGIKDSELLPLLEKHLDKENPRKWYWALMDYGAALKKTTPNPNRRSAHYTRQSAFKGSLRQIRGSLIRSLVKCSPAAPEELRKSLDVKTDEEEFYQALKSLEKDSLVAEAGGRYRIKQ